MRTGLCCYLSIIFLILVSSSSFATLAVTQIETGHGAFAFPVICSHATNLNFCVRATDGPEGACALYQPTLESKYSFAFSGVQSLSNGTRRCSWTGKNPANLQAVYASAELHMKAGLCPKKEDPPPEKIIFGRQGRWFPQELDSKRCFKSCEYTGGQNFTYRHFVYTNGIMTEFTSKDGLKSTESFCVMEPEPSRNNEGEVTYESNCDDAMFKQICDFINWFRNDSEMPEPPEVQKKELPVGNVLNPSLVDTGLNENTTCFQPIEFNFFLSFSRDQIKQELRFENMCAKIEEFGNLWRALYLIWACFIIFGGRK